MSEDCLFLGDSQAAKVIYIPKNTTTFITNQPNLRAKSGKKMAKNPSAKKMSLAISYALQRRVRAAENII
jgi:hypothetical protein